MWYCMFSSTAGSMFSTSARKRFATDTSASCGHGWNQSMAVLLMSAGKLRARMRKRSPTGLKHSTTCSSLRTLSRKNSQQFSMLSIIPVALTSLRTALHMLSRSSGAIRSGM